MMATQVYPGCPSAREFPYPNYAAILPDPGHYVFKNIERRQRLRDQRDYLKRKNEEGEDGADGSKPEGEDDDGNVTGKNDKRAKDKEKERAPAKMFDTKFLESVRLHHQNISQDDKSFKFSSEADEFARGSIPQQYMDGPQNNQQNMVVNQSLLSINQYSSNAMNLKKNQRGEVESKPYNRNSTRNFEYLIQEFIKRDSIMISDGNEQQLTERQRMQALALGLPTPPQKKGEKRSSNQKQYELRLNTEDGEAIGK